MARKRPPKRFLGPVLQIQRQTAVRTIADLGNVCLEIRERVVVLLHTDEHARIDLAALQITLEPHPQHVVAVDDRAQLSPIVRPVISARR
jgi:hypothetical protein